MPVEPLAPEAPASPAIPETRRVLSNRAAYLLAAFVIGLGLFASATPSPLYRSYSVLFDFSPLTLTLIYATYSLGVLASLLVLGSSSDDVGRRPVLLVSLGTLMASTVLFMLADSTGWLFAARGLQGIATGAALSAASASLLDFHPRRDPAGVGLTNATASVAGLGLGILVSSVLVQIGAAPRVLPFVLLFALFVVAFAGAYLMPEPVSTRRRLRLKLERPSIPPAVRRPFVLASLAVVASWSIGALFFSIGPGLAAELFDSTNVVVSSIGIVALTASAAVAQFLTVRIAPWLGAAIGSVALAAGMALIVGAAHTGVERVVPGRVDRRRRRFRGSVPRRAPGARCLDSTGASGLGDVGVLHRRLRLSLDSGSARRPRRHRSRAERDLRALRQRRRRAGARRRGRGLADAAGSPGQVRASPASSS